MKEKITEREMAVLCFTALFSPLIRTAPSASVAAAGKAGWLSPLAALIPALLTVWILKKGMSLVPEGGLGQLLQLGYGRVLGRIFCGLEGAWLFAELSVCFRLYGERFLGSVYRDTSLFLFILTLAVIALWQSRKSLPAVARLAQISFFPLTITVAAILVLGIGKMEKENWLPIWWNDVGGVAREMTPMLSIFGLALAGFFLGGQVRREKKKYAQAWTVVFFLVAGAVSIVVLGLFGPGMSRRLQVPLFTLAKEVQAGSLLERLEAFVIAVWVLSDLLLVILLEKALCRALADAAGLEEEKQLAIPVLFGAVFGSVLCGSREELVLKFAETWLQTARFAMIYLIPLAGCLLALVRERKKSKKQKKGG